MSTSHAFTITVNDAAPTFAAPANQTLTATSSAGAVATYTTPSATDFKDGTVPVTCSPSSGSTFVIGITTLSCTATNSSGMPTTHTFTITVLDAAPEFAPPADIIKTATSAAGAVVTYTTPTAVDFKDGTDPVVCVPPSASTFAIGVTTVECTATNSSNMTTTHTFTVTVKDAPPDFTSPPDQTLTATSGAGAVATYTTPAATDFLDGTDPVTCAPPSGSTFPIGVNTVTCTSTNSSNMTTTHTFTITVLDASPQFAAPPDQTITATSASGAVATYTTPTAVDFKDGTDPVTCSPASGSTFPIGADIVNCTATNSAGLSTHRSFTITVVPPGGQNHPPVCLAAGPSAGELWPPNHQWVPITIKGVTDADGDPITIRITSIFQDEPINGLGDGDTAPDGAGIGTSTAQVRAERAGPPAVPGNGRVYHIGFTATDDKGGSCTGDVAVGVPHDQSPQRRTAVDDGPLYNSVSGAKKP